MNPYHPMTEALLAIVIFFFVLSILGAPLWCDLAGLAAIGIVFAFGEHEEGATQCDVP